MRSVTHSMGVPLDGYIVGPDGGFDWAPPDEEVFRFATDQIRTRTFSSRVVYLRYRVAR